MKHLIAVFSLLALVGLACNDQPLPPPDEIVSQDILDFVSQYNFPRPQPVKAKIRADEQNLTVFTISYGEPQDCPSGCFYAMACGLKSQGKIGWLSEVDSSYFDLDSTDTYLFSDEFWQTFNATFDWGYHSLFIPLMIKDLDTPVPVLKRIAEGLSTYIMPYYGYLLLSNSHASNNREILTILANLPVFQGDGYGPIREQAQLLLSLLGD